MLIGLAPGMDLSSGTSPGQDLWRVVSLSPPLLSRLGETIAYNAEKVKNVV